MSLILLATYFVFTCVYSQCKWQFGQNTLDLSCLSGRKLIADDDGDHEYTYTICSNGAGRCDGDSLMCKQVAKSDRSLCYEIGRWNPDESPTYTDGQWQFSYANGGSCGGSLTRTWAPIFKCDPSVDTVSYGQVTELFGSCRYELEISTKYACPGVVCEDSSGLSGGWIFILICLIGIVVYFIIGYIIMATTVNKERGFGDFNNNIPNRALWCSLPGLVWAGCTVSREFIMGLFGKGDGDDGSTPLTES